MILCTQLGGAGAREEASGLGLWAIVQARPCLETLRSYVRTFSNCVKHRELGCRKLSFGGQVQHAIEMATDACLIDRAITE